MRLLALLFFLIAITTSISYSQNNRPQEPKEPFGYHSENIVLENKVDSIYLAGTFTYPETGSYFPAVILISGSGPQNRNSEIVGHKPFLVIADYLTKRGIAVLRIDDRGTGASDGNHNETGLDGFVRDAKSAVNFLRSRQEVDKSNIGLIGHSLGGIIAPIVASESKNISFVVLLAGSGIRGDKLMLLQKEKAERKMGVPEASISMGQKNMKGAYDIILESKGDQGKLQSDLKEYFTTVFGAMLPQNQITSISKQLSIPWLVDLIKFDPKESLSNIDSSVLALIGSNDLQVPAKENLEAIEKIIRESGNNSVETVELQNLNHLFQESETGLPNEYATIEQTFSPDALKILGDWIIEKTQKTAD